MSYQKIWVAFNPVPTAPHWILSGELSSLTSFTAEVLCSYVSLFHLLSTYFIINLPWSIWCKFKLERGLRIRFSLLLSLFHIDQVYNVHKYVQASDEHRTLLPADCSTILLFFLYIQSTALFMWSSKHDIFIVNTSWSKYCRKILVCNFYSGRSWWPGFKTGVKWYNQEDELIAVRDPWVRIIWLWCGSICVIVSLNSGAEVIFLGISTTIFKIHQVSNPASWAKILRYIQIAFMG